jgi:RHS repeat-associated protein
VNHLPTASEFAVRVPGQIFQDVAFLLAHTSLYGKVLSKNFPDSFLQRFRPIRYGDVDVNHKFTGQEIDNETGLYYYNARYYDPQLCRFITADTLVVHGYDPQDLNRYAYARNNPLKYTDPSGHGFGSWLKRVFKSILGGIAAGVAFIAAAPLGPVAQLVAAGAAYGAVTGGIDGGIKGALAGAGSGAVGGLAIAFGGPTAAWLAFTATAAYTGLTQGAEGLANLGADLIGGGIGFGIGVGIGPTVVNAAKTAGQMVGNVAQGIGRTFANAFGRMPERVGVGLTVDVHVEYINTGTVHGRISVRHYTDAEGKSKIIASGYLGKNNYVTLSSEIPSKAGRLQIENILEIQPGRGRNYVEIEVMTSNLRVPDNGVTTSGGAWQRQLIKPESIYGSIWRRPPGRPSKE